MTVAAALALPALANADTYVVTSNQEGSGSLRDRVAAATAHPGSDIVRFAPQFSFALVQADQLGSIPVSAGQLRIEGPGADGLKIYTIGGPLFRLDDSADLTVTGLSLLSAQATGVQGGTFSNDGKLTLDSMRIESSGSRGSAGTAGAGGAVANRGTLLVDDTTFSENGVSNPGGLSGGGGAILNLGTARIDDSRFVRNIAHGLDSGSSGPAGDGAGGAILNRGELTITDSTLTGNQAIGGFGYSGQGGAASGAALDNDGGGNLTVRDSTFSENLALGGSGNDSAGIASGGAIGNYRTANFRLESSTLTRNISSAAAGGGPGTSFGGAIDNQAIAPTANSAILASTITHNTAFRGGNLSIAGGTTIQATIVTDADNPRSGKVPSCETGRALRSQGYNLEDGNSCGFDRGGDQTDADPKLGALADNGGKTKTMAIGLASPALDAGVSSGNTDQRGFDRPVRFAGVPEPEGGDGSDIGAYELQAGPGGESRKLQGSAHPRRVELGGRSCVVIIARERARGETGRRIQDVRVRLGGKQGRTGRRGKVRICNRFERPGRRVAKLDKRGFEPDRVRIRIVRS